MKKIIMVTVAIELVLVFSVAFAQRSLNPEDRFRKHAEKLASELELTENQKTQMESQFMEFRDEMTIIRENEEMTKEEKKETFFTHFESHMEKLEQLLTDEQVEKFQKHHAKMKENFKHGKHVVMFPDNPDFEMSEEFKAMLIEKRSAFESELSNQEKEQIAMVRQQMKTRKNDRAFSHEECKDNEVKKERRSEYKNMIASLHDIIEKHEESLLAVQDELFELSSDFHGHGKMHDKRHPFAQHEMDQDVFEELHFNRQVLHFLLMDTGEDFQYGSINDKEYEQVMIYPNPVNTTLTVAFDLHQNSQVSIELLNKYGGLLEVLDQSQRLSGHNTFTYDASFLAPAEVYFVKVSKPEIVVVKKFIKL